MIRSYLDNFLKPFESSYKKAKQVAPLFVDAAVDVAKNVNQTIYESPGAKAIRAVFPMPTPEEAKSQGLINIGSDESPRYLDVTGFVGGMQNVGAKGATKLFHGTSKKIASIIKKEGFKIPKKIADRSNILQGASEFNFPNSIYFSKDKKIADLFSSGKAQQYLEQKDIYDKAWFLRARTGVPSWIKDKQIKEIIKKYPELKDSLRNATSYTRASKIIDEFADNFKFVDKGGESLEVVLKPNAKIYNGKEFKTKRELVKEGYDGTIFKHPYSKKGGIGDEYIIFNLDVIDTSQTFARKAKKLPIEAFGLGALINKKEQEKEELFISK